MTARKADKLVKEFGKLKLVFDDLMNKVKKCSKQTAIDELSRNTIGETVKECIELKIEEHNLTTATAAAPTEPNV